MRRRFRPRDRALCVEAPRRSAEKGEDALQLPSPMHSALTPARSLERRIFAITGGREPCGRMSDPMGAEAACSAGARVRDRNCSKIVRLMCTRPGCWRGLLGRWLFRGRNLVPGGAACTQGCVRHRVRRENPPVRHMRWKKDVVTPKRLLRAPVRLLRSNLDAMPNVRMRGIREGGRRVDGKALRG